MVTGGEWREQIGTDKFLGVGSTNKGIPRKWTSGSQHYRPRNKAVPYRPGLMSFPLARGPSKSWAGPEERKGSQAVSISRGLLLARFTKAGARAGIGAIWHRPLASWVGPDVSVRACAHGGHLRLLRGRACVDRVRACGCSGFDRVSVREAAWGR